jgi:hypothetical protein
VEPVKTPEFDAALARTRTVLTEQCGVAEVRVVSTDYKYEGMPAHLTAGAVIFTLVNLGTEPHEAKFFRIAPGDVRPFTELIGLPEPERSRVLTSTEVSLDADPGDADIQLLKLSPGHYGAACLIPRGSTAVAVGTGPLHASLGEAADFTVQ